MSEQIVDSVRIPHDRIGILVGPKGETKRRLERAFGVKIRVDSSTGDVTIRGEDGYAVWKATKAVKGIARGMNIDTVLELEEDDKDLEVINLGHLLPNDRAIVRYKARIIGTHGAVKKTIEQKTGTKIVVHGKTVTILGKPENIYNAKRAIEMILEGAQINTVYKYLADLPEPE